MALSFINRLILKSTCGCRPFAHEPELRINSLCAGAHNLLDRLAVELLQGHVAEVRGRRRQGMSLGVAKGLIFGKSRLRGLKTPRISGLLMVSRSFRRNLKLIRTGP